MKLRFSILLFLAMVLPSLVVGGKVVSEPPIQAEAGTHYALFFACNDYKSNRKLHNPIKNAREIAGILRNTYGFQTEVIENPSLRQIEDKLEEYDLKFRNGTFDREGQLLVYFSGHGGVEKKTGFFLPSDADPSRLRNTALDYPYWRNYFNDMDCRHVFVAIDACFSVRFDPYWNAKTDIVFRRPGELSEREKLLLEHSRTKTRIFFTSDGKEEATPDKSGFAKKFIEGLYSGGGPDQILTSQELFAYVDQARPKPHCRTFGDDEARSSFLFVQKRSANQYKENLSEIAAWEKAERTHTVAGYRVYISAFPKGDFVAVAREEIDKLEQSNQKEQDIAAWNRAKSLNTVSAYESYLRRYPAGLYYRAANAKLKELKAAKVTSSREEEPSKPSTYTNNPSIVSGRVTDAWGNPLEGATILIKGTTSGVLTDSDGRYSINNSYSSSFDASAIFIFAYLGFERQEIAVNGRRTINVTMKEDLNYLNEIIPSIHYLPNNGLFGLGIHSLVPFARLGNKLGKLQFYGDFSTNFNGNRISKLGINYHLLNILDVPLSVQPSFQAYNVDSLATFSQWGINLRPSYSFRLSGATFGIDAEAGISQNNLRGDTPSNSTGITYGGGLSLRKGSFKVMTSARFERISPELQITQYKLELWPFYNMVAGIGYTIFNQSIYSQNFREFPIYLGYRIGL